MTKEQLPHYKSILEAKLASLSNKGSRRREEIEIQRTPDAMDEVQFGTDRAIAIGNLNMNTNLARQIREALARIDDGSFGICLSCEENIAPKRLNAVPWAKLCIRCQESEQTGEGDETEETPATIIFHGQSNLDAARATPASDKPPSNTGTAQAKSEVTDSRESDTIFDRIPMMQRHVGTYPCQTK